MLDLYILAALTKAFSDIVHPGSGSEPQVDGAGWRSMRRCGVGPSPLANAWRTSGL